MDEIKTPSPDAEGSRMQELDKTPDTKVTHEPIILSVGGDTWKEVPNGTHSSVCSKVMPDFKYRGIPKLMLYFTITEGSYTGHRARMAFGYSKNNTGPFFGAKSKFYETASELFPDIIGDGSQKVTFDPVELFEKKHFLITTELRNKNAMVQEIKHDHSPI